MRSLVVLVLLAAPSAMAYPWMVKHNYGSCGACHVDPSGAGQLTSYGRAQAEVLVRWKTSKPKPDEEQEVPKSANFLWFLELPDVVNLSGDIREGVLVVPGSSFPVVPLLMAQDLYATINVDRFVFHGTGGYGLRNRAGPAFVLPQCDPSKVSGGQCGSAFISREYWAGAKFGDEAVMVRAGRMNLPFGLRNNEHTSLVRSFTVTDTNVDQQLGLSASYNSETLRGEVMAILGNYQLGPDAYRERGYSAFAEYALSPSAYLGFSSLVTHANADQATGLATIRHAHGLFARIAPTNAFAILAEADFLAWVAPPKLDRLGFAALLQGDLEVMQGLHLMLTAESGYQGTGLQGPALGGWLSAAWYFLPHCELRIDNIVSRASSTGSFNYTLLAQLHFFL